MKYFVLLAFVLCVVCCNAQNTEEDENTPFSCKASEWFKKDCNSCECGASGTWAQCDGQLCDPVDKTKKLEAPKGCKDKERFNDGCNSCFCANGMWACTLRDCFEIVGNRDTKPEEAATSK